MTVNFTKYQMKDGRTRLDAEYFNPVFQDLDNRLGDLEALKADWDTASKELVKVGLERIDGALRPAFDEIAAIAHVGVIFTTTSSDNMSVQNGGAVFTVSDHKRFAPTHLITISPNGQPDTYMRGTLTSFDKQSGQIGVEVFETQGSGTFTDWVISSVGQGGPQGEIGLPGQNGTNGADGLGVPAGGATGAVLTKQSGADNDAAWEEPAAPGITARQFFLMGV